MSGKGIAVRLSIENAEQVKAALIRLGEDGKAALAKLNFDTSSAAGPKLFQAALNEAEGSARGMLSTLGPLGGVLGSIGGAYIAAGAAAAGFAELVRKSVEVSEEEEQAQRRIAAVLTATGNASGQTGQSVEEMANRISAATLQTREDVLNAAAVLATFRNVGPDAFERTLHAAADMSAVFGGDLTSNVQKLGLALDDPIKGMDRLRRSGLDLSVEQKQVIIDLEQTGHMAQAQTALLDALSGKLGGAGAAQNQGLTGAMHGAGLAWHDFMISFDQTGHFTDIATAGINVVTAALDGLKNHSSAALNAMATVLLGPAASALFSGSGAKKSIAPYTMVPGASENAILGPSHAAQERQDELGASLDLALKQLIQEGSVVGERQRFIDQKLQEIAKANETTVAGLKSQFPDKYKSLASAAGHDYDSAHANQTSKSAAEAKKYQDDLTLGATQAANQRKQAEDAYQVDILEGRTGYFDALKKQNDDWLQDQLDAQQAETDKEVDNARLEGQKLSLTAQQTEDNINKIKQAAADKAVAIKTKAAQNEIDIERRKQGALYPLIQKGAEDTNQALKTLAADGLNSLEQNFLDVIKGSESVGDAIKKMVATVLEEVAKLILEKQVIAPLAKSLNDMIDGLGGSGGGGIGGFLGSILGSANGNAFSGGNVVPFAKGGVVDGATYVPMAMMGESGPEAVIPLSRGSNGKLGISGAGAGAVHNHFSPSIVINGNVDDGQVAALRQEMRQYQRDFFNNSVQAYVQMKSRRIVNG